MLFNIFDPTRFSLSRFMNRGRSAHDEVTTSFFNSTSTRSQSLKSNDDSSAETSTHKHTIEPPQLPPLPLDSSSQASSSKDVNQDELSKPGLRDLSEQPYPGIDRPLYTPHGRWAWTMGLPILNSEVLMPLSGVLSFD